MERLLPLRPTDGKLIAGWSNRGQFFTAVSLRSCNGALLHKIAIMLAAKWSARIVA
jgi:hypothetical protein